MNRIAKFFRDYALVRFLFPLGIVLIIFGIVLAGIVNRRSTYPKVDATVTRADLYEEEHYEGETFVDATYRVFVKYTVNGTEYEEELGIIPEIKPGTTVKLDYNPKDPTDISQPTSPVIPIVMIAGGAAALVGGVVSVILTRKKNKALKEQEKEWTNGN